MVLITGGAFQGQIEYAIKSYGGKAIDGGDIHINDGSLRELYSYDIIYNLHILVMRLIESGIGTEPIYNAASHFSTLEKQKIFVCDDIGMGIVPIAPIESIWREETGRLCCHIAAKSSTVIRMVAGLPQVLKSL